MSYDPDLDPVLTAIREDQAKLTARVATLEKQPPAAPGASEAAVLGLGKRIEALEAAVPISEADMPALKAALRAWLEGEGATTGAPPVAAPFALPAGYKPPQALGMDKTGAMNWNDPKVSIYLPTWVGGDQGNGVGGSFGAPWNVLYNDDGSVDLKAGMEGDKWRMGWLQFNKPLKAKGKWGVVLTSQTANAVNAFFAYASNSKELDFELVRRDGKIGWAPAVHLPKTGGGTAHSSKRPSKLGEFKLGVPQRLEVELFDDRCEFSIDGKVFETITPADMTDGAIWDTTTSVALMTTVERHAGWAGWTGEDYAKPNRVTVHGLLP